MNHFTRKANLKKTQTIWIIDVMICYWIKSSLSPKEKNLSQRMRLCLTLLYNWSISATMPLQLPSGEFPDKGFHNTNLNSEVRFSFISISPYFCCIAFIRYFIVILLKIAQIKS